MHQHDVEITGHLMDSGILSQVLSDIRGYGGDYVITRIDIGHEAEDESHAVLVGVRRGRRVAAAAPDAAADPRRQPGRPGRRPRSPPSEQDGVFPDGFYSTTNLVTRVRLEGKWLTVDNPEMDCGLVVRRRG